jgi:Ni/Co efflux regulator RcnB
MKSKIIALAILATTLAAQGSAFADDHGHRDYRRGPPSHSHYDNRHYDHRNDRDYYRGSRGAGPRHDFYRGQRLNAEYRRHEYVVDNWRGHHLKAPPRGYRWVQTGPDYVLIAAATGIIAQIVLGN